VRALVAAERSVPAQRGQRAGQHDRGERCPRRQEQGGARADAVDRAGESARSEQQDKRDERVQVAVVSIEGDQPQPPQ